MISRFLLLELLKLKLFQNELCLSEIKVKPVMFSDGRHIACSFHPEFSSNNDIYEYFSNLIEKTNVNIK